MDSPLPHLEMRGAATQLIVDSKPFLVPGAELNSSSASSLAYVKPLWPRRAAARLNPVLAAVNWDLIEAAEGQGTPAARAEARWAPLAQELKSLLAKAPVVAVEDVCQPVKSAVFFPGNITWVPNPDGKSYDVIIPYEQQYGGPASVAIIDLGSGQVKVENYPRELGWHMVGWVLGRDGKCYLSQLNYARGLQVEISIYDPAANQMKLRAFATPSTLHGETHPIAVGADGKLYAGGSHPSAATACIMVDPATGAVTDYGACGPTHEGGCWAGNIGADETHIYIASGRVPWYLVTVEKTTRHAKVLARTDTVDGSVQVRQGTSGVTASVAEGKGKPRRDYWCFKGEIIPQNQPCPWKEGPATSPRRIWQERSPAKLESYLGNVAPPPDGQCELWLKADVPNAAKDPAFPGWSCIRYQVETYPQVTERVIETADGRIFGTGGNYSGHYLFDPASGSRQYLGKTGLSHYSTALADGKIYMSGYPNAPVLCYDTAKPWTLAMRGQGPGSRTIAIQDPQSNPQRLCYLRKSGCHKMYASAVGKSGCLYFGGQWIRDGDCGGIGWWDPEQQQDGGFWESLSNQQLCFMCAAAEGRYIVISTLRRADPVLGKPKPNEGRLFILDDGTRKIVREITVVEGVRGPGPIAPAGGHRIIGWTNDPADAKGSILYGVDVETDEVCWKKQLPCPCPCAWAATRWSLGTGVQARMARSGRSWAPARPTPW